MIKKEDKKMRNDKKKNIAKVVKEVLKEPLQTQREIAKKTWLWLWTANRIIQEIEKSWEWKKILDNYEKQQKILTEDFKQTINEELLVKFISLCWSKTEATKQLEDFLLLSIEWNKKRRNYIKWNTRYELLSDAWFKCQACWEKPLPNNNIVLHIDHIIPFNQWWLDVIENYQVLCNKCNCSKWDDFNFNHK